MKLLPNEVNRHWRITRPDGSRYMALCSIDDLKYLVSLSGYSSELVKVRVKLET